jgi:O-antigen/teichoic acid export membrane protein
MSALSRFAWRVGRFITIYGAGMGLQLLLGVVTTIVIVHYLPPETYGELGLYLLVPSTVVVLANIGLLQGTNLVIARESAQESPVDGAPPTNDAARRVLGTGVILSLASGSVFVALAFAFAPEISRALGSAPHGERMVEIGAISGALAGGWRLASNTLRYARRPVAWAIAHISRAAFSVVAIVILLADGQGVFGAILGFAIGTGISFVFAIWMTRANFTVAFDRHFAAEIMRGARGWFIVVVCYQVILSYGVYFVSRTSTAAEVGLFSLATSLAAAAHYVVSAFLYSSGPLRRAPIQVAVVRESGEARANGSLFEFFTVMVSLTVLMLGVFAPELVKIAPRSYAGAAALVPVIAMTAVGRGFFAFTYSLSPRHDKRLFQWMGALALVLYVALAFPLGSLLGAKGVAIAGAIAFLIPAAIQFITTQVSDTPMLVSTTRLLFPVVLTAVLIPFVNEPELQITPLSILIQCAIVLAYLALLAVAGVLPVGAIRLQARELRKDHAPSRRQLRRRVRELTPLDSALMRSLLRDKRPVEMLASEREESETELLARFLVITRSMSDVDGEPPLNWRVGRYLMFTGPYGERDAMARRLVVQGADPLVLDRLEQVTTRLRRLPKRAWSSNGTATFDEQLAAMLAEPAAMTMSGEAAELEFIDEGLDDGGDDN